MTYISYDRFLNAVKKFPRWSNARRRPIESNAGKLLKSIIEEIAAVEDAIIEYKKEFFIVNYIGKEDTIADYLYSAQVGPIENLDSFILVNLDLLITDKIKLFYENKQYAYYQDGYLIMRNQKINTISYKYNGFDYKTKLEKFHVWNIFDEFAWFVGLTRFDDETNKELMQRTLLVFRNRTNSSEQGLKNTIKNALINYGTIDNDEIIFEQPSEKNLYNLNSEHISFYEELAKINRDMARTKRWDIDYWENKFVQLGYIPHIWDADVEIYKNGVGYNESLMTSTIRDLNLTEKTDIEITGYKKSKTLIEEYIKNKNISQNINLKLKKYTNAISPIDVQYKITASTITELNNKDKIYIDCYNTFSGEKDYYIDDLFIDKESGIEIIKNNSLKNETKYKLKFLPISDNDCCTMEINKLNLIKDSEITGLLKENNNFIFENGILKNKNVLFHGTSIRHMNISNNLIDNRDIGFKLNDSGKEGYSEINVSEYTRDISKALIIESSGVYQDILNNPTYIKYNGFTLKDNALISGSGSSSVKDEINIELSCRDIKFDIYKTENSSISGAYCNIEVYINGELDDSKSEYNVSLSSKGINKQYSFKELKDVKIVISRNGMTPIKVNNIHATRYEIEVFADGKIKISGDKTTMVIPANTKYISIYIKNYGQYSPNIKSVHIGSKLNSLTSAYIVEFETQNTGQYELDIESNCKVQLIDAESNKIIANDYNTKNSYINSSTETRAIFVDLDRFSKIYDSSIQIYNTKLTKETNAYIELKPGQITSVIRIYGDTSLITASMLVKDVLDISNTDTLYINKNSKCFIIKSKNGTVSKKILYKKSLRSNADTFKIRSEKINIEVVFVANQANNVEVTAGQYTGDFDYIYIYDKDSTTYIAYNKQKIIKNLTENIDIINNFLPIIPISEKVLYEISEVSDHGYKIDVSFMSGNQWTISASEKMRIKIDADISNFVESSAEIKDFNKKFYLSNNIALDEYYDVNGVKYELGKYIITVPDHMEIKYSLETFSQDKDEDGSVIYIEEDGFNKLLHSNIDSVVKVLADGLEINAEKYNILKTEGIICWNDKSLTGKRLQIVYTYQKPIAITISDLEYLYQIAGYQIDTMEKVEMTSKYLVKDIEDGYQFIIDYSYFKETPDKIATECTNPSYTTIVVNNMITAKKIGDEDRLITKSGYYYVDGQEYYLYADKFVDNANRIEGVQMHNVIKVDGTLLLQAAAKNYLVNSIMETNKIDTLCIVDFTEPVVKPNVSNLNAISSCDSYAMWNSYDMAVELTKLKNGHALSFSSNSKNSYAILDITKSIEDGNKIISCLIAGNINISLGIEEFLGTSRAVNSIFVKKYKDFSSKNDKAYLQIDNIDQERRYYVIVTGTGIIDEILVQNNKDIEYALSNHTKAISKIGFDIEEMAAKGQTIIDFSTVGSKINNVEIDMNETIETNMSVNWDITKVKEFDFDNDIYINNILLRNQTLISQNNAGTIETKPIKILYKKSVIALMLKLNEYPFNDLKGFDITAYGCNLENGSYVEIGKILDDNILQIFQKDLYDYIKFKVEAKDNKVIRTMEVFAKYKETKSENLKILKSNSGSFMSKVFDTCANGNYRLSKINLETNHIEHLEFYIRGCKIVDKTMVWTEWKKISIDETGNVLSNDIDFNDYRLFQFKVSLLSDKVKIKIFSSEFEVY